MTMYQQSQKTQPNIISFETVLMANQHSRERFRTEQNKTKNSTQGFTFSSNKTDNATSDINSKISKIPVRNIKTVKKNANLCSSLSSTGTLATGSDGVSKIYKNIYGKELILTPQSSFVSAKSNNFGLLEKYSNNAIQAIKSGLLVVKNVVESISKSDSMKEFIGFVQDVACEQSDRHENITKSTAEDIITTSESTNIRDHEGSNTFTVSERDDTCNSHGGRITTSLSPIAMGLHSLPAMQLITSIQANRRRPCETISTNTYEQEQECPIEDNTKTESCQTYAEKSVSTRSSRNRISKKTSAIANKYMAAVKSWNKGRRSKKAARKPAKVDSIKKEFRISSKIMNSNTKISSVYTRKYFSKMALGSNSEIYEGIRINGLDTPDKNKASEAKINISKKKIEQTTAHHEFKDAFGDVKKNSTYHINNNINYAKTSMQNMIFNEKSDLLKPNNKNPPYDVNSNYFDGSKDGNNPFMSCSMIDNEIKKRESPLIQDLNSDEELLREIHDMFIKNSYTRVEVPKGFDSINRDLKPQNTNITETIKINTRDGLLKNEVLDSPLIFRNSKEMLIIMKDSVDMPTVFIRPIDDPCNGPDDSELMQSLAYYSCYLTNQNLNKNIKELSNPKDNISLMFRDELENVGMENQNHNECFIEHGNETQSDDVTDIIDTSTTSNTVVACSSDTTPGECRPIENATNKESATSEAVVIFYNNALDTLKSDNKLTVDSWSSTDRLAINEFDVALDNYIHQTEVISKYFRCCKSCDMMNKRRKEICIQTDPFRTYSDSLNDIRSLVLTCSSCHPCHLVCNKIEHKYRVTPASDDQDVCKINLDIDRSNKTVTVMHYQSDETHSTTNNIDENQQQSLNAHPIPKVTQEMILDMTNVDAFEFPEVNNKISNKISATTSYHLDGSIRSANECDRQSSAITLPIFKSISTLEKPITVDRTEQCVIPSPCISCNPQTTDKNVIDIIESDISKLSGKETLLSYIENIMNELKACLESERSRINKEESQRKVPVEQNLTNYDNCTCCVSKRDLNTDIDRQTSTPTIREEYKTTETTPNFNKADNMVSFSFERYDKQKVRDPQRIAKRIIETISDKISEIHDKDTLIAYIDNIVKHLYAFLLTERYIMVKNGIPEKSSSIEEKVTNYENLKCGVCGKCKKQQTASITPSQSPHEIPLSQLTKDKMKALKYGIVNACNRFFDYSKVQLVLFIEK